MAPPIIALISALLLLTFLLGLNTTLNTILSAQENGEKSAEKTITYGCHKFPRLMHCDPISNKFSSYQINVSFSKVYSSTNQKPEFTIGEYNMGLEMHDGNREYLESPIADYSLLSSNYSVSFWIKQTSDTSKYGHVVSSINEEQTAGWYFDVTTSPSTINENSNQMLRFIVSNSRGDLFGANYSVPLTSSKFVNIVGTFDGSKVRLYKDGILFGTSKFSGKFNYDKMRILDVGSASFCSSCHRWAGIIDDLRFYNRTLTKNEIEQIALSNTADSSSDGLVMHFTFDDNIRDSSGINNGRMFSPIASMAFSPDGRMFFTEKNTGRIMIMSDDHVIEKPFAVIPDIYVNWEQGLLGLTVDPDFVENHYVYAYYTTTKYEQPINRVVRFTAVNNTAIEMIVLLDDIPASKGYHSGGALAFGPDDKLYITVGDARKQEIAQDPSIVLGKILRINRDGTIPRDNPFPNSPVFTLGHRNMYGLAFDEKSGIGIVTENGDLYYDEINLIQKGGNYGYPTFQPPNISPELSNDTFAIKPLRSYWNTLGPTQAVYYSGNKFPLLKGKFLFTTFQGNIYAVHINETSKQIVEEDSIKIYSDPHEPLISIAQSSRGDIYFGGYNIYKLHEVHEFTNNTRKKTLFPVEIVFPTNMEVKMDKVSDIMKFASLDTYQSENDTHIDGPAFLKLKIPRDLFDKIYSVYAVGMDPSGKIQQYGKLLNFTQDYSTLEYNSVKLQLPKNPHLHITINGTIP